MISNNTTIVKADLPVGFAYSFNSSYRYVPSLIHSYELDSFDFHGIIATYISLHLSIHNYKHVFQISCDAFLLDGQYC